MTRRRPYPPGLRPFRRGWQAYVRIDGHLHTQTFPAATPLDIMTAWLAATRRTYATRTATAGTFAGDVDTFLRTCLGMPSYADRARHMARWVAVFGRWPRSRITPVAIAAQIAEWRATLTDTGARRWQDGTLKHWQTALQRFYRVMDGPSGYNPVRDVPRLHSAPPEPRGVPYALIRAVLAALPDTGRGERHGTRPTVSLTKARLTVMAYTGLTPAQLARLRPEQVDLDAGTLVIPARRKGRGTTPQRVPLIPDGLAAMRAFAAADAWGTFSTSSVYKSFRCACRVLEDAAAARGQALDLSWLRPYDLRHSFGSAMFAASGDLRSTGELLAHSTLELTKRYTLAAVTPRLTAATLAAAAAFAADRASDAYNSAYNSGAPERSTSGQNAPESSDHGSGDPRPLRKHKRR